MNDLSVTDREHARISPSGFARAEACTMSVRLSAHASPEVASVDADAGSAQHAIAERCLIEGLDTFELRDLRTVRVKGREVEVTAEMLDAVQFGLDWLRSADLLKGRQLAYEKVLHLSFAEQYLGEPMYGFADVLAPILPVVVVDFKFGFNPVAASDVQLGLYVLAAVLDRTEGSLELEGPAGTSVVIQPNERDGKVKVHEWSFGALRALRDRVIDVLKRIRRADYTYAYGEHCRWCKAISICPHLAAVARDFALANVAPTPEIVASGAVTSAQLDEWYQTIKVLDQFSKAFMQTFETYLIHGGSSKVAKLVRKRTTRRWIDEAKASAALAELGADPWRPQAIVTPAEAERRLPPAKRSLVEPLTEKPIGELTVADANDPKDAVDVGATLKAALQSSIAAGYLAAARSRADRAEQEIKL